MEYTQWWKKSAGMRQGFKGPRQQAISQPGRSATKATLRLVRWRGTYCLVRGVSAKRIERSKSIGVLGQLILAILFVAAIYVVLGVAMFALWTYVFHI